MILASSYISNLSIATSIDGNSLGKANYRSHDSAIDTIMPLSIPFEMIGDILSNYAKNNLRYGRQYHVVDTLRYGINSENKQPNPNSTTFRYQKLREKSRKESKIILHHCIWKTFDIDIWYISVNDSLRPITGNIHRHALNKK